jgi:uncharacterized protein YcfJ
MAMASVVAVSSGAEQVRMPRQRRSSVAIGDRERDKMEELEEARCKGGAATTAVLLGLTGHSESERRRERWRASAQAFASPTRRESW